jgi:hypothetical protein
MKRFMLIISLFFCFFASSFSYTFSDWIITRGNISGFDATRNSSLPLRVYGQGNYTYIINSYDDYSSWYISPDSTCQDIIQEFTIS